MAIVIHLYAFVWEGASEGYRAFEINIHRSQRFALVMEKSFNILGHKLLIHRYGIFV